jgi:L-iditol 2-dehydrogenase
MTAAVMHAPGDIRVEEVPVPTPGPGQVLLKVAACGICGSDIPRMNHNGGYVMPIICGHEFSGWVETLGEGVTEVAVGDLVTVPPLIPCWRCDQCARGNFSLCEDYDYFGSRSNGAYAQYVVSPANNVLRMPEGLDPLAAAMIDPAAIALHAIWKTGLRQGYNVAVVGAGPIGLFAVEWAVMAGADRVVAIDISVDKQQMMLEAGAAHAVTSREEALAVCPAGFDVVVESAGSPVTADLAAALCAPHGEAVFIGIPHAPVELRKETYDRFLRQEVTLRGSWNSFSAPFPGAEWRTVAAKMADGSLGWEFMISHRLGLEDLPTTIQALGDRSIVSSKVLFEPNGAPDLTTD